MNKGIKLETLHVVSDLHLGGNEGFQIFASTPELVWLIEQVRNDERPGLHGLLINGDFIDFLAEQPCMYFDPQGAVGKIDRVWHHFSPIFEGLKQLLATPTCRLIINLGNHDLELALPWVRAHLIERLCEGVEAAHSRLFLITDGTGVRCSVGGARVICLHGNELDSWNVTDFEMLRRIGRDCQLGILPESWVPNAGSQLVIEVMNEIKSKYPFIDLLKPETEAVLPILAALNPGLHRKLLELTGVAGRRAKDIIRMRMGFLDTGSDGAVSETPYGAPTLPPTSLEHPSSAVLVEDVELAWSRGVDPISLIRGKQNHQLGFWSATFDYMSGRPRHEVLREALEHLDSDRSFDPYEQDTCYRSVDAMVGTDIDLVVTGHTHLERSLPRVNGMGWYFNTGTWARLIQIDAEVRANPTMFEKMYRILEGGTIAQLDRAKLGENGKGRNLIIRRNSVLIIEVSAETPNEKVRAALYHVQPASSFKSPHLSGPVGQIWNKG